MLAENSQDPGNNHFGDTMLRNAAQQRMDALSLNRVQQQGLTGQEAYYETRLEDRFNRVDAANTQEDLQAIIDENQADQDRNDYGSGMLNNAAQQRLDKMSLDSGVTADKAPMLKFTFDAMPESQQAGPIPSA